MSQPIEMEVNSAPSIDMQVGDPVVHYITDTELSAILAEYVTSAALGQRLQEYPTKTEVDETSIVRWKRGEGDN